MTWGAVGAAAVSYVASERSNSAKAKASNRQEAFQERMSNMAADRDWETHLFLCL